MSDYSPSNYVGRPIICTNPCAEVPLEDGGACNLGSINLSRFVKDGFTPEAACCMDPANFALAAVRDGNVRVGEKVIIFGMGAIGLFTVQLARLSGATDIIAVDPIQSRRELALKHGATLAVDPDQVDDFALASRDWLGDGADVTIEAILSVIFTGVKAVFSIS